MAPEALLDSETVSHLQEFLRKQGYEAGPVDGTFGIQTSRALQQFLADAGHLEGLIGGDFGWRSTRALQEFFRGVGALRGEVDGIFGPRTCLSLRVFLQARAPASDGRGHSLMEFKSWYGDGQWRRRWESSWTPPGLTVRRMSADVTRAALDELMLHFPKRGKSRVLEIGWDLNEDRTTVRGARAGGLEGYPSVERLVSRGMDLYGDSHEIRPRINVTCRLYSSETSGLAMHTDRVFWYEDKVYGCILENTSDRVLEFQQGAKQRGAEGARFFLEESDGVCLLQEGDARFRWKHGVARLTSGTRVSVSWRWFKEEHIDMETCEHARRGVRPGSGSWARPGP